MLAHAPDYTSLTRGLVTPTNSPAKYQVLSILD